MTIEIVGALLIIVTAVLADKVSDRWKKLCWALFVSLVLAQAGVQIKQRRDEQAITEADRNRIEKLQGDVGDTKAKLDASLLEQAHMNGHLEGIQIVMENLSKSGFPGFREFAAAIGKSLQRTESNRIVTRFSGATNKELLTMAVTLSGNILKLAGDTEKQMMVDYGKEPELNALFRDTETQYQSKYQADAIVLRDEILSRLPLVERPVYENSMYEYVNGNTHQMTDIATDLQTLAKRLPQPRAAHP